MVVRTIKVTCLIIKFFNMYVLENIFEKIVINLVMSNFQVIINLKSLLIMDFNLSLITINSFIKKMD
jgi:hypothetical protein